MTMSPVIKGHLYMLASQIVGAFMMLAMHKSVHFMSPQAVAMFRSLFGWPMIAGLAFAATGKQDIRRIVRVSWTRATMALTGIYLNQILVIAALSMVTPTTASLFINFIPLYTALFAVILKLERMTASKALGMFLCIGGALYIVDPTKATINGGIVCLLFNTLAFSIFVIVQRMYESDEHPLILSANVSTLGMPLFVLTFVIWASVSGTSDDWAMFRKVANAPPEAWGWLFAVAASATGVYGFILSGARLTTPVSTSIWAASQPIFVILMQFVAYGTLIKVREAIGGTILIFGVLLVMWSKLRETRGKGSREGSDEMAAALEFKELHEDDLESQSCRSDQERR